MKNVINQLYVDQDRLLDYVPMKFKRTLKINWDQRLVALVGARGTGKSTLVLQHLLEQMKKKKDQLYITLDNPLVAKEGIFKIGKEFFDLYGDILIINEVHKQKEWATDVKALYDMYPGKKQIILGSSKMNILNQKGDLSRRALIYNLKGLSFREYIWLKYEKEFPVYDLGTILTDHLSISHEVSRKVTDIRKYFIEYLQAGFYPFFFDKSEDECIFL